jgi:iron complex transport system permease protein
MLQMKKQALLRLRSISGPAATFSILIFLILLLFPGNLFYGSVRIPADQVWDILTGQEIERQAWANIVIQSRLPQAITALLAGAALAVSGLMLQTLFQNPLAGPSILGISDGANLGVAIVMLYMGGSIGRGAYTLGGSLAVIFAALAGAIAVLTLIVYFSGKLKNSIMVLIVGIMIGYLASSGISMLNFVASAESVRSYVMWGMGNFSGVALKQIPVYATVILLGILGAVLLIKPLNALLLGERYADNLGIPVKRTRVFVLLCNMLTVLPFGSSILPLNAITPLLGAPVMIYVIVNRKNIQYFN